MIAKDLKKLLKDVPDETTVFIGLPTDSDMPEFAPLYDISIGAKLYDFEDSESDENNPTADCAERVFLIWGNGEITGGTMS